MRMCTFSLCVVHVCTSYDDVVKDLMSLFVLDGKGQRVLICDEGNDYTGLQAVVLMTQ